jgi:ribosomal protein S18 acetylase RimI-like enzyme
MKVRPVRWTDFEELASLRESRYDEVDRDPSYGMVTRPKRPTRADLAAWFGEVQRGELEGRSVTVVAEEKGRIAGMARIVPDGESPETSHLGILGIEVRREFRGKGIGRSLLAYALGRCRGRFESVQLSVIPVNTAAIRLYRRLGFVEHGRLPRAFQRKGVYHDFILMHRPVPSPRGGKVGSSPRRRGTAARAGGRTAAPAGRRPRRR